MAESKKIENVPTQGEINSRIDYLFHKIVFNPKDIVPVQIDGGNVFEIFYMGNRLELRISGKEKAKKVAELTGKIIDTYFQTGQTASFYSNDSIFSVLFRKSVIDLKLDNTYGLNAFDRNYLTSEGFEKVFGIKASKRTENDYYGSVDLYANFLNGIINTVRNGVGNDKKEPSPDIPPANNNSDGLLMVEKPLKK